MLCCHDRRYLLYPRNSQQNSGIHGRNLPCVSITLPYPTSPYSFYFYYFIILSAWLDVTKHIQGQPIFFFHRTSINQALGVLQFDVSRCFAAEIIPYIPDQSNFCAGKCLRFISSLFLRTLFLFLFLLLRPTSLASSSTSETIASETICWVSDLNPAKLAVFSQPHPAHVTDGARLHWKSISEGREWEVVMVVEVESENRGRYKCFNCCCVCVFERLCVLSLLMIELCVSTTSNKT